MSSQVLERSFLDRLFASVTTVALLSTLTSCVPQQSQSDSSVEAAQKKNSASSTSAKTLVLRVGFISSESKIPIGPEGWAQEKGTLAPELKSLGVTEVKFFPFVGGPALNESLTASQLDMGLYGDTPALVGRSAGLKTKLINQNRVGNNAWLVAKRDGPRSVAELKGQKIGVAKGTYLHRYLLGLLEKEGVDKEVKLVQIPNADARVALGRGDIAAYPFSMTTAPLLVAQGFPKIDEAKQHDGLVGSGVSVVTEEFLAKHPSFPQKWNQVRQKALQEIKANPEEFYKFAAKASGGLPIKVVKLAYPLDLYPAQPFIPEGLKLLNSTKQFLADQKLLKSDFEIKDWQVPNP